jgi:arginine/lysine/ornithine decarboxylase
MLEGFAGRVSFHMPGHKGLGEGAWADLTELPGGDDLHRPAGAYLALEERAAGLYGAAKSLLLVGGSTLGVQAMLLAALRPGDAFLLPRNAHHSAWAACVLGDLRPIAVLPGADGELTEGGILRAMDENPGAKGVFVTRPDYYGRCPPLFGIAQRARALGMKLLVDEAHGAHLAFARRGPGSAAGLADLWCQSLHKTLPALTQTALLHMKDAGDEAAARRAVDLLETSSPSSLLALSAEDALVLMQEGGEALLEGLYGQIEAFERGLDGRYRLLKGEGRDPFRLVVDVRGTGASGYALSSFLATRGVDMEMADALRIVGIPSVCSKWSDFERLLAGLLAFEGKGRTPAPQFAPAFGQSSLPPREAFFAGRERVALKGAAGRICAEAFGLYPPGLPFAAPGERITQDVVSALGEGLALGAKPFGMDENGAVFCIKRG